MITTISIVFSILALVLALISAYYTYQFSKIEKQRQEWRKHGENA